MKAYTPKEFDKMYGAGASSQFGQPINQGKYFNTQAFADVWTRAGQDIATTKSMQEQFKMADPITGENNYDPTAMMRTLAMQGGLAVPSSIMAGFGASNTGQSVSDSVMSGVKAVTPDSVEEAAKQEMEKLIEGYDYMNPMEQIEVRNKLKAMELAGYSLPFGKGKPKLKTQGRLHADYTINPADDIPTPTSEKEIVKNFNSIRESVRASAGENSVDPYTATAVGRLTATETGVSAIDGYTSSQNPALDLYEDYLAQAKAHFGDGDRIKGDAELDPPIATVGRELGDAFEEVVKQQREIGALLGEEIKNVGKFRVSIQDAVTKALGMMQEGGLSFNPRTKQFTSFQGNKFADGDIEALTEFMARVRLLGDAPTVREIDNFIGKIFSESPYAKAASGVNQSTNAERIINTTLHNLRQSLNPEVNQIQQLERYWALNKAYKDVKEFTKEGSSYLGKVNENGVYTRDVSLLKNSVQSILQGNKKDWLMGLKARTGYPAIDKAQLALQAMKDVGDYRGESLLQMMGERTVPLTKAGLAERIASGAMEKGKAAVLGKPEDQTRAYLRSIGGKKTDLRVADKPLTAKDNIPKTPTLKRLEKEIKENVAAQKKAIAKKDWPLVAKLKEAYIKLKTRLEAEIKTIKKNMKGGRGPDIKNNPEGGFIDIGAIFKSLFGKKKVKRSELNAKITEMNKYIRRQEKRVDRLIESGVKNDARQIKDIEKEISKVARQRDALYERGKINWQAGHIGKQRELGSTLSPKDKPLSSKNLTTEPTLKTKRDVVAKDVAGNKVNIKAGTVIDPKLNEKGQAVITVDGTEYKLPKNQYQNLVGQSDVAKASPFAPELDGMEVTVRLDKTTNDTVRRYGIQNTGNSKYSQYTLPGGEDYREIIVQAPAKPKESSKFVLEKKPDAERPWRVRLSTEKQHIGSFKTKAEAEKWKKGMEEKNFVHDINYKSSHWDEPNPLFHLRMNDRTWNGKKVTFMEELQSDWARDGREKGFNKEVPDLSKIKETELQYVALDKDGNEITAVGKGVVSNLDEAKGYLTRHVARLKEEGTGVPYNPLLKNWQIPATKKALMDAVERDADIFAWINGAQTSERYKLSTQVEKVNWKDTSLGKTVEIEPKGKSPINFKVKEDGAIIHYANTPDDFIGKRLDEVLGKGMADSIMSKKSGTLEGEGLNFGGEWAHNLYDKQVRDIVKKLTGAEVKTADMGLPIGKGQNLWRFEQGRDLFVTEKTRPGTIVTEGNEKWVLTEIIGTDKFKAIELSDLTRKYPDLEKQAYGVNIDGLKFNPQELQEFSLKTKESTATQQYIELTPEVKAKIKSEAPKFKMKNPSAGEALPLIFLLVGGGAVATQQ